MPKIETGTSAQDGTEISEGGTGTMDNSALLCDHAVCVELPGYECCSWCGVDEKHFALHHSSGALFIFRPRSGSAGDFNPHPRISPKFQRPCGNLGE